MTMTCLSCVPHLKHAQADYMLTDTPCYCLGSPRPRALPMRLLPPSESAILRLFLTPVVTTISLSHSHPHHQSIAAHPHPQRWAHVNTSQRPLLRQLVPMAESSQKTAIQMTCH